MAAVDPTYPAYPVACGLAALMMMLVLLSNLARHSWNLGITFLCTWICLENLIGAVDGVVWSDNADVRLYVWCDITSRLDIAALVGINIAPLLIIRRLYMIVNLQSEDTISKNARRWNLVLEWTCGLVWPLMSAGPIYYLIEGARFDVQEGLGCTVDITDSVITSYVLGQVWTDLPPFISVIFYYPKVAKSFYRQRRAANQFLRTDHDSVSRTNYIHLLVIASVDLFLTLPFGLISLALDLRNRSGPLPFLPGWDASHSRWAPTQTTYASVVAGGISRIFYFYWGLWTTPALAFGVFAIFGLTSEARTSYWRIIFTVGGWFRRKRISHARSTDLRSEFRPGARSMGDISFDSGIGADPSFANSSHADQDVHDRVEGSLRELRENIEGRNSWALDNVGNHDNQRTGTEMADNGVAIERTEPVVLAA